MLLQVLCAVGSLLFLLWQLAAHSSLADLLPRTTHWPPLLQAARPVVPPASPASHPAAAAAATPQLVRVVSPATGIEYEHYPFALSSEEEGGGLEQLRWGVMFDAGSTGSRVHVYRFRMPVDTGASAAEQPLLEDEIFAEVKPGLSAYVHGGVGSSQATRDVGAPTVTADGAAGASEALSGPDAAAESLRGLLDLCMEAIPAAARSRTPLALRATAGLRLLGPEASEAILASIRRLFRSYPFAMEADETRAVQVMDGAEEGVFAWITVNYLAQRLQDFKADEENHAHVAAATVAGAAAPTATAEASPFPALRHGHPKTCAILDLGGASTQIVFEPEFASYASLAPDTQNLLYTLPYGSNNYFLFERSYLGYGLMEARRRIKEAVAEHPALQAFPSMQFLEGAANSGETKAGEGLALLQGQTTPEGEPVFYHPCLSDAYEERIAVPAAEGSGNASSPRHVLLRGYPAGHASCAALARTLFPKDTPCPSGSCSFGGHFALPLPAAFGAGDLTHPTRAQEAHVYAFSYFYDRTLDAFDLEEERAPAPLAAGTGEAGEEGASIGALLRVGRIRSLAEQVCAFSARVQRVRSAVDIEAEKDLAARTILLDDSIQARRKAGCTSVRVKGKDGGVRTVLMPAGSEAAASASTDASPAAAAAAAPLLDEGACMVEERPDLSLAAEEARASFPDSLPSLLQDNPHLCLDLTYLHTLLHHGYDLPEHTQLHVFKRIQRKEIGWCLGATLKLMAQQGW